MLFAKKVEKARGMELIEEVAGRFLDMVDELNSGVDDCHKEQESIRATIENLKKRNETLTRSVQRAETITTNLRTLLGE